MGYISFCFTSCNNDQGVECLEVDTKEYSGYVRRLHIMNLAGILAIYLRGAKSDARRSSSNYRAGLALRAMILKVNGQQVAGSNLLAPYGRVNCQNV